MRKKDRGQKEGRRASSRSNVDDVGSPTTVRPGPPCACRHRWLQTPTVREGNDPGRRAFYPLPKRPAVSRADTLSGGECSTTKTLRAWLRGWPGPPPPRGLSSPVRQPQRERRRVGAGGDRLALAAIQWKVRLGRRAASGAATHHVMQKLQMSLLGGPSPEPGLPTLLMWGPTPPPPGSLTGADASGQHGCVSRYSLEAAKTRPSTLPLARPTPAVTSATPRTNDRALASPVPSPPARQRGDTTGPRLPCGVPG